MFAWVKISAEVLEYEQEVMREKKSRAEDQELLDPPTGEFDAELDPAVAAELSESA